MGAIGCYDYNRPPDPRVLRWRVKYRALGLTEHQIRRIIGKRLQRGR